MSRNERPIVDPNILASLHQIGGRWHAVVARQESEGLRLIEAKTFVSGSTPTSIATWLTGLQVGRVIGVLPATLVICRTSQLPNGPVERLLPALRLQAEGHLLGEMPNHRLAMAILDQGEGDSTRTGLIVAWPTANALTDAALALERALEAPVTWVPEPAALAALIGQRRSTAPVLWCDRAAGAISIFLTHPGGVMLRATREENGSPEDWVAGVGRVVADSALGVGRDAESVGNLVATAQTMVSSTEDGTALIAPSALEKTFPGVMADVATDRAWWQAHAIGVGALLAATGSLSALAELRGEQPVERPSPVAAIASRLAQPRIATTMAVIAAALLVGWPLLAATLRLAVLEAKAPELRSVERDVEELERTLAMYRALADQVLPMHKLLADIANSTPEGVELEQLAISRADGVSIRGLAAAREGRDATPLVLLMNSRLNDGRVFTLSTPSWDAQSGPKLPFRITASIARPYQVVNYDSEWDFGATTLAERRDPGRRSSTPSAEPTGGNAATAPVTEAPPVEVADATPPRATGTARPTGGGRVSARPSAGASDDPAAETAADPDTVAAADQAGDSVVNPADGRTVGRRGTGEAAGAATRGGRPGQAEPEVPAPLTAAQIRAMSKSEAQHALTEVATARSRRDLPDEVIERLKEEFALLLEQTRSAR